MARRKLEEFEESPLINRTPLHSTIHAEKLDQNRFTDLQDDAEGTSPVRIIIYAVIVIIVGVGAAFLVRNLVSNNQQTPDTTATDQTEDTTVEEVTAFNISLATKSDSTATNIAKNTDYVNSSLVTLGDSTVDATTVNLNEIQYVKYTTFARTYFMLENNDGKLPKTTVSYDSAKNTITVDLGQVVVNEELKEAITINDIVKSISYSSETNKFTLTLAEKSKYRVSQENGNLFIDVKTERQLTNEETSTAATPPTTTTTPPTTTTTPPTTTTTTDSSKPAAPFYTNDFSQNKQYISSKVTGTGIGFNNFWIWDQGSFFEFSLGQVNVNADSNIPNAAAYIKEENSKIYLYLEVENLSNAPFSQTKTRTIEELASTAGITLDPSSVNFKQIELVSFASGKATYRIELKKKADFKLLTQDTYDASAQILSIQIKD